MQFLNAETTSFQKTDGAVPKTDLGAVIDTPCYYHPAYYVLHSSSNISQLFENILF